MRKPRGTLVCEDMAMRTQPGERDFLGLVEAGHTLVPVWRTVVADLETPVSAFLRMAAEEPEAFLLESVEGGERVGRYTFIGMEPYRRMWSWGRQIAVEEAGGERRSFEGDVFWELKREMGGHRPARMAGLPPFTAGAVGFFSYDVVRQIERLPVLAVDELGVPDACLMFFDQVVAFDHVKKEIHLMVTVDPEREMATHGSIDGAYGRAEARLNGLEARMERALPAKRERVAMGALEVRARTSRAEFVRAVEAVKEYVAAGDVFQCVLSQRFDCEPGVDAFEIYRALRIVNPSPYLYFLRFGMGDGKANAGVLPPRSTQGQDDVRERVDAEVLRTAQDDQRSADRVAHLVGSSPELLVRVKGRRVEYRPIAGTRGRGEDEAEDARLEAELRADAKEVAEHVMLVDLGRNDLGRVSEFGSVKVRELMFVERYSHVMHLVSALEGTLKEGLDAIDAFRACFPAGTLSGAPKIRAMEVIEEMEPARRGVYGGSIVYVDFSGNLDSCIAIRTLFMDGERGHIQAGAGIVADSVAESEWQECRNKAQAVVRAIERAREM